MRGYSFFDTLKNCYNLLYTRIFWKKARLVRLPILARNRKNIIISHGFTCGTNCRLNPSLEGFIQIGKDVTLGDQCQIEAMERVEIGDNVLMASKVYIGDANHGQYDGDNQSRPDEAPNKRPVSTKPIRIGDNVWIGNAATILGGVEIGSGSVIGSNSVVTKSIPENCIAVGNPAKVIKKYDIQTKKWKII